MSRNYLDLLSQQYDETADKIKQVDSEKVRTRLAEMHLRGQSALTRALLESQKSIDVNERTPEVEDLIEEAESALDRVQSLVRHHLTTALWNDNQN